MRIRDLIRLLRLRVEWCDFIHWIVITAVRRQAERLDADHPAAGAWSKVALHMEHGGGRDACITVARELAVVLKRRPAGLGFAPLLPDYTGEGEAWERT